MKRQMNHFCFLLVGGLLLLMLTACSTAPTVTAIEETNEGPHPLQGSSWQLHEVDGEPVDPKLFSRTPYLVFRPVTNRVEGFGGCNGFFASYTGSGQALDFGDVASTRMACPRAGKTESRFFDALDETTRYELVGGYLLLFDDEEVLARLKPRVKENE